MFPLKDQCLCSDRIDGVVEASHLFLHFPLNPQLSTSFDLGFEFAKAIARLFGGRLFTTLVVA